MSGSNHRGRSYSKGAVRGHRPVHTIPEKSVEGIWVLRRKMKKREQQLAKQNLQRLGIIPPDTTKEK